MFNVILYFGNTVSSRYNDARAKVIRRLFVKYTEGNSQDKSNILSLIKYNWETGFALEKA
jgi:hypothetical protein